MRNTIRRMPFIKEWLTPNTKTVSDRRKFIIGLNGGEQVNFRLPDDTLSVQFDWRSIGKRQPLDLCIDRAVEFAGNYRAALKSGEETAIAEWRDELEVMMMHADYPAVSCICSGALQGQECGAI